MDLLMMNKKKKMKVLGWSGLRGKKDVEYKFGYGKVEVEYVGGDL